jgi:hypothetical protein
LKDIIYLDSKIKTNFDNWTESEKKYTKDNHWWSYEEIEKSSEDFFTDKLLEIFKDILNQNIPDEVTDI